MKEMEPQLRKTSLSPSYISNEEDLLEIISGLILLKKLDYNLFSVDKKKMDKRRKTIITDIAKPAQ